jgi:hypothetical protein
MRRRLEHGLRTRWVLTGAALAILAAIATGCGSSDNGSSPTSTASPTSASDLAPIHGTYSPKIDPSNFVATIDNR